MPQPEVLEHLVERVGGEHGVTELEQPVGELAGARAELHDGGGIRPVIQATASSGYVGRARS